MRVFKTCKILPVCLAAVVLGHGEAVANEGYARMLCFGLNGDGGNPESLNGQVILVQQTDNSLYGPEVFVPSHPEYKPKKYYSEDVPAKVLVYANMDPPAGPPPYDAYVDQLLEMEPIYAGEDSIINRVYDVIGAGDDYVTVRQLMNVGPGLDSYINNDPSLKSQAIRTVFMLECTLPWVVEEPGLE